MVEFDDLAHADPWHLLPRNRAIWWLGERFYALMHDIKFKATPEAIRYLHRDPVENDTVLLRELIHSFQTNMTPGQREDFRACLTWLFPPRPGTP